MRNTSIRMVEYTDFKWIAAHATVTGPVTHHR